MLSREMIRDIGGLVSDSDSEIDEQEASEGLNVRSLNDRWKNEETDIFKMWPSAFRACPLLLMPASNV